MKRLVAALVLFALPAGLFAQASAVPTTVSYQGRVTDSTGTPIGNGTTVNRVAIFRVYDAASGGTRLWSEQQTVAISSGDFSVLLGTGTAVVGESNVAVMGEGLFTGATRFLGVTIADAAGALGSEISPRQQLVTTAYAFRARVAESVLSQSVTSAMIANGAVTATQLAANTVTAAQIANTTITATQLADSAVTSAKITDGTIATADIAHSAVTAAKLGADVGVWTASGSNVLRTTGSVGIGTSLPTAALSLGSSLANTKLAVWDDGATGRMGFGVQGSQFRIHANGAGDRISFLNAPAGTETVTILGNGNVGIGNIAPDAKLLVAGGIAADGGVTNGYTFRGTGDNDSGMFSPADGTLTFRTDATEKMRLNPNGNLGIGHTAPPYPVAVYRDGDVRAMFVNADTGATATDGLHIGVQPGGPGFIWHHENAALRIATNSSERLRIEGDGRMGLNTTNADGNIGYLLRSPNAQYTMVVLNRNGAWSFAFEENGTATKIGGGGFAAFSDRRLKKDVANLAGSLDQLLKLRPVTFDYKDEHYGRGRQTGFIAQEVQEVFPNWIDTSRDGHLTITTRGFEALAVQSLRELRAEKDAQNAALTARVRQLEAQNAALQAQVAELGTQHSATTTRLEAIEQRMNAFARTLGTAGNQ